MTPRTISLSHLGFVKYELGESACHMRCECGLTYDPTSADDVTMHAAYHEHFRSGLPMPHIIDERVIGSIRGWQVTESSATDAKAHRRDHAKLAMVAQRETPNFKAGYYADPDEAEVDRRAFALIKDKRGIGLVFAQLGFRHWAAQWCGSEIYLRQRRAEAKRIRVIQRVWIAPDYRRDGLATELVALVVRHFDQTTVTVGWEAPFSPVGADLLRSLCPNEFRLAIGDAGQLHEVVAGVLDDG